ncbi:MAG TPA: hypothetical protein VNO51_18650 [Ilumatobacteraceae bacterium]|nr:hypothetical protein [Ilumatobacteraceae bacterium]
MDGGVADPAAGHLELRGEPLDVDILDRRGGREVVLPDRASLGRPGIANSMRATTRRLMTGSIRESNI